MRVSTALGAVCLGVLAFIILTSKTGGLTFEGGTNKSIEVGGALTKPIKSPTKSVYYNTESQSEQPVCPSTAVNIPPKTSSVIIGKTKALVIDTEGKDSFVLTDCVDLNTVKIELCDVENKCTEGTFANGSMQAKPAT